MLVVNTRIQYYNFVNLVFWICITHTCWNFHFSKFNCNNNKTKPDYKITHRGTLSKMRCHYITHHARTHTHKRARRVYKRKSDDIYYFILLWAVYRNYCSNKKRKFIKINWKLLLYWHYVLNNSYWHWRIIIEL